MTGQMWYVAATYLLFPLTLLQLPVQGQITPDKALSSVSLEHETSDFVYDVSLHERLRENGQTVLNNRPNVSLSSTQQTPTAQNSSDTCGQGLLAVGDKCYKAVTITDPFLRLTWFAANQTCSQHGGRLFTLKSVSDIDKLREFDFGEFIYIGALAAKTLPGFPSMYHQSWVWSDRRVAHTIHRERYIVHDERCVRFMFDYANYMSPDPQNTFSVSDCFTHSTLNKIICEVPTRNRLLPGSSMKTQIQILNVQTTLPNRQYVKCPANHLTHNFLACDLTSSCWAYERNTVVLCDYPGTPLPPSFICTNQMDRVPYSFVCDHRKDCPDGSDETFCRFAPCRKFEEFECRNQQCVGVDKRCDRAIHCADKSDEERCQYRRISGINMEYLRLSILGPRVYITMNPSGFLSAFTVNSTFSCPHTHFWCQETTVCLPVYLRCNEVADCPGSEDEAGCDSYTCPGYYRCRGLAACLPVTLLCDGLFQCPQRDDELLCGFTCPHHCTCYGNAFFCHDKFLAGNFLQLRFLDGRGSNLTTAHLVNNTMLVYLSLIHCNLSYVSTMNLPNLLLLDLSTNLIKHITNDDIRGLLNLQVLVLASNPILLHFITSNNRKAVLSNVKTLDLSNTNREDFSTEALTYFPALTTLNLSNSGIKRILGEGFHSLSQLKKLDLRGCPMILFPRELFQGLEILQEVHADNYKLCCPAMLPKGFNTAHCSAPEDEVSSCEALLRSSVYRVFLSLFAVCTLLGNMISVIYRICMNNTTNKTSFGIFVTNLCVSDFLMGMYLAIIGIADHIFKGSYLWKDLIWTTSIGCRSAGFLSMLSSETSVSFIGLITLDRFIVIRFPFTNRRFRPRSAQMASAMVWVTGFLLAVLPLFPSMSHWTFYSQTGICIPLPITRRSFPGQNYSFGVMIVFNFAVFLMIGSGQVLIYKSITESRISSHDTMTSKDVTVARRLLTVVMSDFMCWFPIGLLGLLAANDIPVPGELNVALAIFVLPINSALNPFLYTINTLMEKSQRLREEKLQQQLLAEYSEDDTKTNIV